jgi:hypothetical protein
VVDAPSCLRGDGPVNHRLALEGPLLGARLRFAPFFMVPLYFRIDCLGVGPPHLSGMPRAFRTRLADLSRPQVLYCQGIPPFHGGNALEAGAELRSESTSPNPQDGFPNPCE